MLKAITLLALLPLVSTAMAAEPAFDSARVSRDIRVLASDAFEGRAPATRAEGKTVDYLITQMKGAGLQPGGTMQGGARGWTQDVPLLRADIAGAPAVSISTGGATRQLVQGKDIALRAALTGQTQVTIGDAPMVFVGYGVTAPERNWDDYKGVDLRGKIVVVLVNDPDFEGGEGDFGGRAMTYYGRWTYKYEEAARRGAAGVLVVHEYEAASYGWPTVKSSNTNTMFDIVRDHPTEYHTQMEGWIQRDLAVDLLKAAGHDFAALKKSAQRHDFQPVVLNTTFRANYAVKPRQIVSKNVLGILPGAGHPDETVLFTAHWDHLGIGQPDVKGDRIYNGAIDNASGVAMMLELARAFGAAPRPDRSVVFMAVTAEEKGLLGSEYYAANPVWPLATTAGVLNTDAVLRSGGATRDFTISGNARLGLLDLLIAEGEKRGRKYTPDPRAEAGGFFRSDHFPMAKRGVPAISFGSGRDMVVGGVERGRQQADEYVKQRYHQPGDEWRADWDLSGVAPDLTLIYAVGRILADERSWPEWSEDSEFRAARDKTKAERK